MSSSAPMRRTLLSVSPQRPRVVILGTGWSSFRVLSDIDASKFSVSVVSPRNHLLFTPMLASSALGTVNQRSICQPVRPVCAAKGARFYESHVCAIDKVQRQVTCRTACEREFNLDYDKLIIGVGFQPNDFGIEGVKEHALFMKETADATKLKDQILAKLEEASYFHALETSMTVSSKEEELRRILAFVIVGGGPTGVELAGELTDFLQQEGQQFYQHVIKYATVHILTYDLLSMLDQDLQQYAGQHLARRQNVHLKLNALVQKVERDVLTLKVGEETTTIPYGTLVWCAGIKAHPFVRDFGLPLNKEGSLILVDDRFRVQGEDGIFAIGDCAAIVGHHLPQTAQVAKQQAAYLAKFLNEGSPDNAKPFKFKSLGTMAYLGGHTAIMSSLPVIRRITGFFAFVGWRSVYWGMQMSFRNMYMLSTDWTRTLIFGRDTTRFGSNSRPE